MSLEYAEDITSKLREFVERNSNIACLQWDPRLPPRLLIDPWSKDYGSKKRIAHYFLLVASIDETRVIGRAENARCLMVELHKKFGNHMFEIFEPKKFAKEIIKSKRYGEHGPLKGQIPHILVSVNKFVMEKTRGDLVKYSQSFSQPKDMAEEIGRYIKRMGGPIKKKAWLYMRWMVRPRPDLRIFDHFSPRDLFIPFTKDIKRVAVSLNLIKNAKMSGWDRWDDVEKITEFARILFPDDPIKVDYPFFLVGRWLEGKTLNKRTLMETLKRFEDFYEKTKCSILVKKGRTRYSAECPMLPGCITEADTEEEVLLKMENAIAAYRESAKKHGFEVE